MNFKTVLSLANYDLECPGRRMVEDVEVTCKLAFLSRC